MPMSEAKGRRGRPPLPSNEVRRNRVVTFMTDREMDHLREIARHKSVTLSATCHRIIKSYLQGSSSRTLTGPHELGYRHDVETKPESKEV